MCLKKGVSVCTCVSVGTIYCDDVNSESICRLSSTYYCISECENTIIYLLLYLLIFFTAGIFYRIAGSPYRMTCSDPEALNTTANCETQLRVKKERKGKETMAASDKT